MIEVKAHIKLFLDGRRTPFKSGYRPLFDFISETKTSGMIKLLDTEKFYPGEEREVLIKFLSREFLGNDFKPGKKFTFGEGVKPLGEGTIVKVLE